MYTYSYINCGITDTITAPLLSQQPALASLSDSCPQSAKTWFIYMHREYVYPRSILEFTDPVVAFNQYL